ncbi:DNA-dependent metalloprotease SPRTN isoform X2 [Halyomorpha halys]|uniref:DNA-dependent metalloprotease SPRTN isoform X2 n=1 Tax=Halyomorpha halys TaxID=286706 RepID=UPI0006D50F0F|nr:sprT-like domain-containing protein Spartan isoform X2 [Halyomorpha halys]
MYFSRLLTKNFFGVLLRVLKSSGVKGCIRKRGGVSISLSLPLLQLRPRKDLVETLLHEMIHAYLFLTANKQDREEHGPLFHEHMHRINKAAGTKITVYHSFHDEVAHYKQHWWRCNGPCQSRKPFFGLVKRSMNRAPGPHDFWYAEHQSSCGGEFIKIKEPENFKARKSRVKTNDESNSLTKYFPKNSETLPSAKSTGTSKDKKKSVKKNETDNSNKPSSIISPLTKFFSTSSSNTSDSKSSKINKTGVSSGIKKTETNNIHGFSSVKSGSPSKSTASADKVNTIKPNIAGFGTGLKSNKGGTLVMNPRPGSSVNSDENSSSPVKEKIIPFTGTGHMLAPGAVADRSKSVLLSLFDKKNSESSSKSDKPVENKVNEGKERNRNLQRQESGSKNKTEEKKGSKPLNKASSELKRNEKDTNKSSDRHETGSSTVLKTKTNGNDRSPSKKINKDRANDGSSTSKEGSVSGSEVRKEVKDEPVIINSDSDDDTTTTIDDIVNCPVCGFQTLGSLINEHLDECTGLQTVLENVQIIDDEGDFDVPNQVQCPSCGIFCLEDEINVHLDACLS